MQKKLNAAIVASLLMLLAGYVVSYLALRLTWKEQTSGSDTYRFCADEWMTIVYQPLASIEGILTGEHIVLTKPTFDHVNEGLPGFGFSNEAPHVQQITSREKKMRGPMNWHGPQREPPLSCRGQAHRRRLEVFPASVKGGSDRCAQRESRSRAEMANPGHFETSGFIASASLRWKV